MSENGFSRQGSAAGRRRPDRDTARVSLSVLDRLVDLDPNAAVDAPIATADAESQLRLSVRRDLEALLNARRRWRSWPVELAELTTSPLSFGIPDFASGAFNTKQARQSLCAEIEDTIRRFEPRFVHVRVLLPDEEASLEAVLRLRIEALLHAEPAPEPIVFDTVLDAATAEIVVRAGEAT